MHSMLIAWEGTHPPLVGARSRAEMHNAPYNVVEQSRVPMPGTIQYLRTSLSHAEQSLLPSTRTATAWAHDAEAGWSALGQRRAM